MDFTHIDSNGNVKMVDVSGKAVVRRSAVARGVIHLQPGTITLLQQRLLEKGDAFACARIAGIMAAKKTAEVIPLCHPLPLEHISIELETDDDRITITASVVCTAKTGAEMEALTSVSIAALAIYDMCKAVDKQMVIGDIRLIEKHKEQTT